MKLQIVYEQLLIKLLILKKTGLNKSKTKKKRLDFTFSDQSSLICTLPNDILSPILTKTNFKKGSSTVEIVWITNGQKVFYVEIEGINQIITLRSEMGAAVGSDTLMDYINRQ